MNELEDGFMEPLHEHNQKTYENICRMYGEGIQRVAVVQPTGSGKSLLMAKLIEDNPNSRFFVLSTSHKINDQFKSKLDEKILDNLECNIYWNMPNMKQEIMELLQPDYIFLDEMHRALAKEWSKGINVLLEMYPEAKVLGLSATPIRYLDKCRNVAEELFNGNLACDMSLSQAILDGILPMARYVCGVYSYEKDTESLNKKIERSCNSDEEKKELLKELKILKENLDKGHGISDIFKKYVVSGNEKFVVFLKNTTHLRAMKPVIEKWFLDAGFTVRLYEVHCKNTDKDKEFGAFKKDTEDGIKLCLSVNMLAEGIHGDIDGVIMLRETISANMYFQMIGRAFACGKKTIPLIFDLVANSQFISDAANLSFPNELRGEIEKRKKECEKEGKQYEVGFDVNEFIVMDEFMDVVSGFRAIEERLEGREWTEEEIEILKKWYPIEGGDVEKRLDGRTRCTIYAIAHKLGIKAPDNFWTEEEIEILKEWYPIEGIKVKSRLKQRTKEAIKGQVIRLDLVAPNSWTKTEIGLLKKYYPDYGTNTVKYIPNKTVGAIKRKANLLGISYKKSIFTDKEDEIIKQYYPLEGSCVYKRLDGKTKKQCISRAKMLGISYVNDNKWSEEENEILYKYYPEEGEKVQTRLNKRSKQAIFSQVSKLGIKPHKYWTEEEIEILKKYYPIEGKKVANRLNNRTETTIILKANSIGLKRKRTKKYRYVYKVKNKYIVELVVNGNKVRCGIFDSEDEAGKVAMQKAKEYGKAI